MAVAHHVEQSIVCSNVSQVFTMLVSRSSCFSNTGYSERQLLAWNRQDKDNINHSACINN